MEKYFPTFYVIKGETVIRKLATDKSITINPPNSDPFILVDRWRENKFQRCSIPSHFKEDDVFVPMTLFQNLVDCDQNGYV